jgi:amidase
MDDRWNHLVKDKKRRQLESIPKEWFISVPSDDVLDVTKYPEECGLLSAKDVEITNTSVSDLLRTLASGEWSSVEVTTAFYKRAVIAHQLVRSLIGELCGSNALANIETSRRIA